VSAITPVLPAESRATRGGAHIVGRSPNAAAQLASRAWRRVRGSAADPDTSLARQREAAGAWIADAGGGFDALLTLLNPDVVVRIDLGALPAGGLREGRGAAHAVGLAASYRRSAPFAHAALVSGSAGIVARPTADSPARSWRSRSPQARSPRSTSWPAAPG
jgi:RNA polymerase sigma-70 factor (ECF subfamily)